MLMARSAALASVAMGIAIGAAQAEQEVAGWHVNCDEGPIPTVNNVDASDVADGCFLTKAATDTDNASLIVVITGFFDEARGQL